MTEPLDKPTALQRHVMYFDPEGTGQIVYRQTYREIRNLGVGRAWSALLSAIIHAALGWVTQGKPSFTIDIASIHRGKHPSDSGIFDAHGELVPERFEQLFAFAGEQGTSQKVTQHELRSFMRSDGPQSFAGDFFSGAEARLFFCVASDTTKMEDGREVPAITKRRLRVFYDGRLLPAIRRHRRIRGR
jgi:peroxygenase